MPFKNKKHADKVDRIILIVDRSGSMQSMKTDAEGGINAFIEAQRKVDRSARVQLVEFNSTVSVTPLIDIRLAGEYYLEPAGMTALYDAVGRMVNEWTYSDAKTNPYDKTIVVIMTDGEENSSKEYSPTVVRNLIEQRTKEGWEFIFLAANIDTRLAAETMGISPASTVTFTSTGKGMADAYASVGAYATSLRTKGKTEAEMDFMQKIYESSELNQQ